MNNHSLLKYEHKYVDIEYTYPKENGINFSAFASGFLIKDDSGIYSSCCKKTKWLLVEDPEKEPRQLEAKNIKSIKRQRLADKWRSVAECKEDILSTKVIFKKRSDGKIFESLEFYASYDASSKRWNIKGVKGVVAESIERNWMIFAYDHDCAITDKNKRKKEQEENIKYLEKQIIGYEIEIRELKEKIKEYRRRIQEAKEEMERLAIKKTPA